MQLMIVILGYKYHISFLTTQKDVTYDFDEYDSLTSRFFRQNCTFTSIPVKEMTYGTNSGLLKPTNKGLYKLCLHMPNFICLDMSKCIILHIYKLMFNHLNNGLLYRSKKFQRIKKKSSQL